MYDFAATVLTVSDLSRSIDFYARQLGFLRGRSKPGRWTEVFANGLSLFLVPRQPGQTFASHGAAGITLVVRDFEAKKAILEERGVAFIGEVIDTEMLRLAIFEDPDGNPLYLVQEAL